MEKKYGEQFEDTSNEKTYCTFFFDCRFCNSYVLLNDRWSASLGKLKSVSVCEAGDVWGVGFTNRLFERKVRKKTCCNLMIDGLF